MYTTVEYTEEKLKRIKYKKYIQVLMKLKLKRNEDELRGATRDLRKELSGRKKLAGRHVNMKNEWWKKKCPTYP